MNDHELQPADEWGALKRHTNARIALGRTGINIPLQESLDFKMAHAYARDAVYTELHTSELCTSVQAAGWQTIQVRSQATSRQQFLQRPDLGRKLSVESKHALELHETKGKDVVFILADGLSSIAVHRHALSLLNEIVKIIPVITFAPVVIAEQARVALSDEIGSLLQTKLAVILIGERPGLSSPDSLGAYLTFNPQSGLTDHARNCVSNIRPEGLPYAIAAEKIGWLIRESLRLGISGVQLKENSLGKLETLGKTKSSNIPALPESQNPNS